jgi:hypothetical protein
MEFDKYMCMQVKLKRSKAALNSKKTHFPFYLYSSTQPSFFVILLVKILKLIHVLLVNTIDLAILVVHFSRLKVSNASRRKYIPPSCLHHLFHT